MSLNWPQPPPRAPPPHTHTQKNCPCAALALLSRISLICLSQKPQRTLCHFDRKNVHEPGREIIVFPELNFSGNKAQETDDKFGFLCSGRQYSSGLCSWCLDRVYLTGPNQRQRIFPGVRPAVPFSMNHVLTLGHGRVVKLHWKNDRYASHVYITMTGRIGF